jgi:threonine/homoserine/homoserine lactone efflux protein
LANSLNSWNLVLFGVAAVVLLGSPGPAIAALVAVGRKNGFVGGLPFYSGLQIGLASAAAISGAGLFTLLQAVSGATTLMAIITTSYLVYLSYKIATSPVGNSDDTNVSGFASTAVGGFLLGVTNPKAYAAFISIMGSYLIVPQNSTIDITLKWAICVIVMIVVDAVWLWLGDIIRKANLSLSAEKALNLTMGATILITAVFSYI